MVLSERISISLAKHFSSPIHSSLLLQGMRMPRSLDDAWMYYFLAFETARYGHGITMSPLARLSDRYNLLKRKFTSSWKFYYYCGELENRERYSTAFICHEIWGLRSCAMSIICHKGNIMILEDLFLAQKINGESDEK